MFDSISGCHRKNPRVLSILPMDRRINAPAIAIGICSLLIPIVMALGSCWAMRGMAPEVSRGALALMNDETGPQGALGLPATRGALLAFDAAGAAAELSVQRADTQSDAARAAQLAASAAPAAALGIGFTDSDPALAAVPAFAKAGRPFIVIGATDPALPERCGKGTFLACFGDDAQARAAAEFGAARFGKRAVVVFDSTRTYPRTLASTFRTHLGSALGGSAVMEFDLASVAPPAIAPHLVSMGRDADFVYAALEPEQVAPVLQAVRSALPQVPVVGGDGFDFDGALRTGNAPTDRVWFTTHAWLGDGCSPEAAAFVAAYARANAGAAPSAFAALGHDAALLALDARRRAGSDDPAAIAAALAATRGFAGITGTIDYSAGPVPRKDVWIVEIASGARRLAERRKP